MNCLQRYVIGFFFLVTLGTMELACCFAADPGLERLIDEIWQSDLRADPLFATHVGDSRYNDQLPRVSLADQKRRLVEKRQLLAKLEAIPTASFIPADRINHGILLRQLRDEISELTFQSYLQPITSRSGFHISFPDLPQQTPFLQVRDYENYIRRLEQFDRYVAEHMELMREGVKLGWVLPSVVLEGYRDSIEPHVVSDATKSLLFAPFNRYPAVIPAADQMRLTERGTAAVREHVVVGYRNFLKFMNDEYVPAARATIAAAALPEGRAFYQHRVRHFTTLDLTPEQVHETGLNEVKRIRAEMLQVMKKADFKGEFPAFLEFLRSDPRFYATSPEQLQKEVAWILKRMDGELPRLFQTLPRTPYGLRPIPDYIAPRTTSAYYQPPGGDGRVAGFYYINTFNLKSRPLYEMEALSLHEAVPGHHLQLALQQELTGLPAFRRYTHFTAYIEGWALYAERLGLEVGFYQDPYQDFGRLTFEMWRACRLVVDTGMHYQGWTREQAIQFMAENTALALHNIRSEVDRYIAWPGQALGYKIGELKIRQLRERATRELG
ncbi:MAG: DUF885 domain-containing protein, partial [Planctomycetota bacterium]